MWRCKKETTSREFLRWQIYYRRKWHRREKLDYYLAQIACEVQRVLMKDPSKVSVENFIVKFEKDKVKSKPVIPLPDAEFETLEMLDEVSQNTPPPGLEERTLRSKTFWLALAGLSPEGK